MFISFSTKVKSEIVQVKIFYDKDWIICKSDKASFYRLCGWDNEKKIFEGGFSDYLMNDIKIVEGNYYQGRKNGLFIFYFDSGIEKLRASFKDDSPIDLWSWYYPNKQLNYSIKFKSDDFHFLEINDDSGKSLLSMKYEFVFSFQNDKINPNMQIKGVLENKMREGNWIIINNNKTLGYDIYKNDKYIKTAVDNEIQSQNEKLINNSLFVPYSIFACESFSINDDISEEDYPFLSSILPPSWKPIDSAVGIIGDSSVLQIEIKPMYRGGMNGLNKSILSNLRLTREFVENCPKYGYAYYEIIIDEDGNVVDKNIIRSPHEIITKIALESLNSIQQFRPAYNNGKPIKSKIISRIKFEKPSIIR